MLRDLVQPPLALNSAARVDTVLYEGTATCVPSSKPPFPRKRGDSKNCSFPENLASHGRGSPWLYRGGKEGGERWRLPFLPPLWAGRRLSATLQKRLSGPCPHGSSLAQGQGYQLVRSWYLVPEALTVVSNLHMWINPQLSQNCYRSSLSLLLVWGLVAF